MWEFIYGIFLIFLYYVFTKVIFEGSCFELGKLVFEVKHTFEQ
jgi:hypothetical protein